MIKMALQVEVEKRSSTNKLYTILNSNQVIPEKITPRKRGLNLEELIIDNANEVVDFVNSNASNSQEKV